MIFTDDGAVSSEEEFSGGETENTQQVSREDQELKDTLLRKFGGHISSLKHEFSKKKKKGKLPNEARQTLLEWWDSHYKWPYPTVTINNFLLIITLLYIYITFQKDKKKI